MKKVWLVWLLIGLAGCAEKDMNAGGITVFYAETQCADPWLRSISPSASGFVSDEARSQALLVYLQTNGVRSARAVRFQEPSPGTAYCPACTCLSGRTIDVTIDEVDWQKANSLGFRRR